MLPAAYRLRSKDEFRLTTRSGVRAGRRNLVLYLIVEESTEREKQFHAGMIVSKAVGNAVTRNRVKRRLRALCWEAQAQIPDAGRVVIRALPAAGTASFASMQQDFSSALGSALRKLGYDGRSGNEAGLQSRRERKGIRESHG